MVVKTLIVDTMPRAGDEIDQDGAILRSSKWDPPDPPDLYMDFEKQRPMRRRPPRRQRGIPRGMEGSYYLP